MTDTFLNTLKELAGKATPGEWLAKDYSEPGSVQMIWDVKDGKSRHGMCIECVRPDDAALIVFLVNHRDDIAAAIEVLQWADYHFDNQDMNHVDYRVEMAGRARAALSRLEGKS